jgi:quercetin 2,3-dioxygenase
MSEIRKIIKILHNQPTMDGAGVHLQRMFGYHETPQFDPFLLLDYFGSDNPDNYRNGFPWHPHRGIETITYVLHGDVEHADSLGNKGVISSGDVQWMTAGRGIIHQEMPMGDEQGRMYGFQLWANLPQTDKMMAPRYQEISSAEIPHIVRPDGINIRIICGMVDGVSGPVQDIVIDPEYLDVTVPARVEFDHPTKRGHTVFICVFKGKAQIDDAIVEEGSVALFQDGDRLKMQAPEKAVRFLLISGKPLKEPIAWRGPIVMNTQEELRIAFTEYNNGTFIKS